MKNELTLKLPYVDIHQLLSGIISPKEFLNLLHEYGFVYFYNLNCDPLHLGSEKYKKLEIYSQNFFSLSLEQKMKYYIGKSLNHRGYVPVTEKGKYGDEK